MVFTTLAHLMDEEFLKEAFHRLRKEAEAGVDQVTAKEYAVDLEGNIRDLHKGWLREGTRPGPQGGHGRLRMMEREGRWPS